MTDYIDQEGNEVAPEQCGQQYASCVCYQVGPHTAHRCRCGGSWSGTEGHETVVTLPGGGLFGALDIIFGGGLP